jgi:hypothetical protein
MTDNNQDDTTVSQDDTQQQGDQQKQPETSTGADALRQLAARERKVQADAAANKQNAKLAAFGREIAELAQKGDEAAVMARLGFKKQAPASDPRLDKIEASLEKMEQARTEAARNKQIEQVRGQVYTYIEENEDKFPLINKFGDTYKEVVFANLEQAIASGRDVSDGAVASEVEDRIRKMVKTAMEVESLRAEFRSSDEETKQKKQSSTLTNDSKPGSGSPKNVNPELLRGQERLDSIASMLKFTKDN